MDHTEENKNIEDSKSEADWYSFWEEKGYFKVDLNSTKPSYGLLMPPPNLTGDPHAGHSLQHLIMDAVARSKRMQGFNVFFQPGVDHAGIQFESTLNKLLEKEGLSKYKLTREEWLKRAWQFKESVYKSFHKTWRLLGISADWEREVFTLDPKVQKAVLEEFKTFFEKGLLYKGAYIVQWCPKDQTAIEDVEMDYEERQENLYFVHYKIENSDEYITIATTRPETIYADSGIAVYPDHPEFKKFVGQRAINPLNGNLLPIFEDIRVDKEFGTGALKITPGHDPLDYKIGQDHNLEILHVVDKTGRMTDLALDLAGIKIDEAEKLATDKLEKSGALEKIEELTHTVPVCERCKTTIEPLISEEYFVKVAPLASKALKNIKKINFIPEKYLKILSDWLQNIHDWCISRPLWWGYRIPVWYCQDCNKNQELEKDKGIMISFDEPKVACPNCKKTNWLQEEKILDTWFSSGMWPLATLGWPNQTPELEKFYPWDLEVTSREIRYLWIARMIMLGLYFKDEIPFKNMFFHGMLRPLEGPKFSKSLGNAVYADELTDQWGVDATRMALYTYTAPDRDGRTSRQILNERAKNFRNFNTKLKNIARFIIDLKPVDAQSIDPSVIPTFKHKDDKDINKKLNRLIENTTKNIDSFNLHLASEDIYNFIWHTLADDYIEKTKDRRAEAQIALEYVFKSALELLHPFMPFITEELWQKLPHQGESIMQAKWP